MDSGQKAFIAGFKFSWLQPENPIQLIRPSHPIRGDIPFPTAKVGQPLRRSELFLLATQPPSGCGLLILP
jgi:hypothetical protein